MRKHERCGVTPSFKSVDCQSDHHRHLCSLLLGFFLPVNAPHLTAEREHGRVYAQPQHQRSVGCVGAL